MTALYTALLEGETKESLADMVCELRREVRRLRERAAKWTVAEMQCGDVLFVAHPQAPPIALHVTDDGRIVQRNFDFPRMTGPHFIGDA